MASAILILTYNIEKNNHTYILVSNPKSPFYPYEAPIAFRKLVMSIRWDNKL